MNNDCPRGERQIACFRLLGPWHTLQKSAP